MKQNIEVYLAHRRENTDEIQTLQEHLYHVAKFCGMFAEKFGMQDWGYCEGLLHDIGKYSEAFQRRIRGSAERVDHATAGAQLCWNLNGCYRFLSYCIAGHHAGLPNTGSSADTGDQSSMYGRMSKHIPSFAAYENEINVPELSIPSFQPGPFEETGFFLSFLIRMLFSCLVDADYLDTEQFMQGEQTARRGGDTMRCLYERLEKYIEKWKSNTDLSSINGRRTEILINCQKMGREAQGLYRLTVPTGGGKTIASLAFALEHALTHGLDRIIYVIPYTSIIEQNAAIFAEILGRDNILEHHCNVDYGDSEELKPMQLAAENWDKPVIVTTNIQFFESLFSNKPSKCRKLHNIANSVIIFDEAQMLPNDYLKPCIAAMEQLLRHYRSSLVLCTATQPALEHLFAEDICAKELCPRLKEQFAFFKRVQIEILGRLTLEKLEQHLKTEQAVLCIFNTKKTAQHVYQNVREEGVFHLSTAMYPLHRKRTLAEIRDRLRQNKRCIVISTSIVEAGVDLDFQTVYRQLAGIDSIIQAAGRCNREGKRNKETCHTYVFELEEKEYMPGQRTQMGVAAGLLSSGKPPEDLETIHDYFTHLYYVKRENLDKKDIMNMFRPGVFPFKDISKAFRLIENDTVTLLILKEECVRLLADEIRIMGMTRARMRKIGQYSISVYQNDLQKLEAAGMVRLLSDEIQDLYVLTAENQYDEEMGLRSDVTYGQAVMF